MSEQIIIDFESEISPESEIQERHRPSERLNIHKRNLKQPDLYLENLRKEEALTNRHLDQLQEQIRLGKEQINSALAYLREHESEMDRATIERKLRAREHDEWAVKFVEQDVRDVVTGRQRRLWEHQEAEVRVLFKVGFYLRALEIFGGVWNEKLMVGCAFSNNLDRGWDASGQRFPAQALNENTMNKCSLGGGSVVALCKGTTGGGENEPRAV